MKCENWKENKIVQKIYELRKHYIFKHLYASTTMYGCKVEDMWLCDCCETLIQSSECLYAKNDSKKWIQICQNCADLWRILPTEETQIKNQKQ